ncbi:MAG: 50S ribosomal protein L25/general stress protein Ctc [Bacteroidales bacterium]|nr:50S ribosomal protein L25/general stress protein Ctc [Bacteroidales bacterium]MBO7647323.1 50S ribosomal protein L25/general stress protein Ctc [Bacteroidales bacterium]
MKSVSISGSLRENVGKKDAKSQRRQGMVPCVIYGGKEQKLFLVEEKQFTKLLYTPEVQFVELDLDGKITKAIVQDTQFHPITDKLLHVDFLEVVDGKPITIEIPFKVKGTSPGVLKGGSLKKRVRKIKVRGLLENIPEEITADISGLDINQFIKIGDLSLDNLTIVDNPNKVVVIVNPTRNAVASAEGEGEGEESAEAEA